MAAISTLTVNLIARTSAFEKGMSRARKKMSFAQRQAMATRKAISGIFLNVVGPAILISQIGRLSKSFIDAASAAEETQSKFDTVFKNLAVDAKRWSDDFAESVGRSRQQIASFLAGLQDTFVPLGFAREKAQEMSQALTRLAVDLASFNNKVDADVIRDLQSAIVGNHETVRKYGVIIMQTTLDQELLNMGVLGGAKAASEMEKAQARLNLIMKGTADAQGDALRTADSYANSVKRLEGAFDDLKVQLGTELLPVMADFVNLLTSAVRKTEELTQGTAGLVAKETALAAALPPGVRLSYLALSAAMKKANDEAAKTPLVTAAEDNRRRVSLRSQLEGKRTKTEVKNQIDTIFKADVPDFAPRFPAASDFGEITSPDVSIAGLAIGAGTTDVVGELQKQTGLLTVIASKEGLA